MEKVITESSYGTGIGSRPEDEGAPGSPSDDLDRYIGSAYRAHFVPLDPSVFNTHHFSAEVGSTAGRVFAHRVA